MINSEERYKVLVLLLMILLSGICEAGAPDTIFVMKEMSSPGISNGKAAKTGSIRGAILAASKGDVIIVAPGFYQEGNITIDKKLTLTGIGYPVLDGDDSCEVITILADSVRISGFQVQNCGVSYVTEKAGIRVDHHNYCTIENNKLLNTFFGIYMKNAHHCTIRNNYIEGQAKDEFSSGNAIHLWYSGDIYVDGNTCKGHRDGIYLEFTENSTITGNHSEHNLRYGLHFMFSNNDHYIGNTFRENGAGVAVMFSNHITMLNNHFDHNWGSSAYGLLLKDISDGDITGNTFSENTVGIYADGANRVRMEKNEFKGNGWALKILGSCYNDTITGNNFLSNTFDVFTNSSVSHNLFDGNFWSDYTGYDLDKNGVGDVPYKPVKLFCYVASQVPQAIILLRSPFVDLVNFAEKVMPSLTPQSLEDTSPLMKKIIL
jgi:nitrous oxidase accessory protein